MIFYRSALYSQENSALKIPLSSGRSEAMKKRKNQKKKAQSNKILKFIYFYFVLFLSHFILFLLIYSFIFFLNLPSVSYTFFFFKTLFYWHGKIIQKIKILIYIFRSYLCSLHMIIWFGLIWFSSVRVLWLINHSWLFNAKSSSYIFIKYIWCG